MAHYAISGVWKDTTGVITDYAIHLVTKHETPGMVMINKAQKYSKAKAIELVASNIIHTAVWNYTKQLWTLGAEVKSVGTFPNKYLRTEKDATVRDNLDNLLNYWNITTGCN